MNEYGGSAEAFAWWRGRVVPGARLRLFTDRTMATPITDLFTPEGEPIADGFVRADGAGWYRFATGAQYESIFGQMMGGDGRLYRMDRADLGPRVFGVESSVAGVAATAEQAAEQAATASQKADESHSLLSGELAAVNTPEGLIRLNSAGKVGAAYLPADSSASSFLTWADYPMPDAANWPSPVGYYGMASLIPENTAEGVRAYLDLHPMIADQQVPVCWLYVTTTNEGAAVVLRSGPDATAVSTTRPYVVWDMGVSTIRQARVSGRWFGPGWPDLEVPTLDDVLAEFAGRMLFVLHVETSPNQADHVWQTVRNYGMESSVIIAADLASVWGWAAAGALAMGVIGDGQTASDAQLSTLVDDGVQWVALDCSGVEPANGGDRFDHARGLGLRTCAYPLTRHYELDRLQGWGTAANPYGADMYATPDPVYCHWEKTRHLDRFRTPPWETGSYVPGQFGNGDGRDAVDDAGRPIRHQVFTEQAFTPATGHSGYLHVRNDPAETNDVAHRIDPGGLAAFWEHQGWCSPNLGEAGEMQEISTRVHFRRGNAGSWVTFAFGMSDDRPFIYQGTLTTVLDGPPGQNGWVLVARPDGALYLRKVTDGHMSATDDASATSGPGAITPGPGMGGVLGIRIRLTPTQVLADLTDTAGAVQRSLVFDDSSPAHRGPYLAFGSRHGEILMTSTEVGTGTVQ